MRRIATVVLVLLGVAACDPVNAVTENARNHPIEIPNVISWSGQDSNGHHIQMSFETSGSVLTGYGELWETAVYPIRIHSFLSTGTYTGTPPAGTLDMRFTSATTSEMSFRAVQDGDTMVGQLVGGPVVGSTDITLTKVVR